MAVAGFPDETSDFHCAYNLCDYLHAVQLYKGSEVEERRKKMTEKEEVCLSCRHSAWNHSPNDSRQPTFKSCLQGKVGEEVGRKDCENRKLIPLGLFHFILDTYKKKYGGKK